MQVLRVSGLRTDLIGPIDLSVGRGEVVAITGPSGSGKSLLLRALADLDPNDGDVWLGDVERRSIGAPDWRRRLALVPAETGWWADDVAAHFERPDLAADLLDTVGLPDALGWQVARLSSGERQRLGLVRALCLSPRGLLLDEPTGALDHDTTVVVERIIRRRLEDGVPVILVTHDPAQATRLGARRFIMSAGRLSDEESIG